MSKLEKIQNEELKNAAGGSCDTEPSRSKKTKTEYSVRCKCGKLFRNFDNKNDAEKTKADVSICCKDCGSNEKLIFEYTITE